MKAKTLRHTLPLMLLFPLLLFSQQINTVTIFGTVSDRASGAGLAGVRVEVISEADSSERAAAISDSSGAYRITLSLGAARAGQTPQDFALMQNYPNPFNPATLIQFQIAQASPVSLDIYNILGQKVRTLVNEPLPAGRYTAVWDGRSDAGSGVSAGIYFYRLQAGDYARARKMVLMDGGGAAPAVSAPLSSGFGKDAFAETGDAQISIRLTSPFIKSLRKQHVKLSAAPFRYDISAEVRGGILNRKLIIISEPGNNGLVYISGRAGAVRTDMTGAMEAVVVNRRGDEKKVKMPVNPNGSIPVMKLGAKVGDRLTLTLYRDGKIAGVPEEFMVPEFGLPEVLDSKPTNGDKDIVLDTPIIIYFSEPVDPVTVDENSFYLSDSLGNRVPGSIGFNNDVTIATLYPENPLSYNTQYTITVTTAVTDLQGLQLESAYVATFTTITVQYSFTKTAQYTHIVSANDVAVSTDGTVFFANGEAGLWVYSYDGGSFTNIVRMHDGYEARGVTVGADGTVFLANGEDGLRAYSLDGPSYINTAHINNGGDAHGVAVGADGTVFLANGEDGLRAYSYNGASLTLTAHINDGGFAREVAVGMDGMVFLANGEDGLRAYSYNGTSFINTAYIYDEGEARGVALDSDGTVFLANGEDGLRAYKYDGNSFNNTDDVDAGGQANSVAVGADGTVFLAGNGLWAYSYNDTSFKNTAHINNGNAGEVAIGADGTIFLAGYGLWAYSYDGASFTNIAHINNGGPAYDIALGTDGTIFLANGDDDLRVYNFNGVFFLNTFHSNNVSGSSYGVAVRADGTVFVAQRFTRVRQLVAFFDNGTGFTQIASTNIVGFYANGVAVGADGTVFLANGWGGLWAYIHSDALFTNTAFINDGGRALRLALGADGTIFLANGDDGLRAYSYDGTSFTNTAHINDGYGRNVTVRADGTVFLVHGGDLAAYRYDDASFTKIAQTNDGGPTYGVALGADGTVFLGKGPGGLWAYSYPSTAFTYTSSISPTEHVAHGVAEGSDGTVFLANGTDGLRAYSYDDSSLTNTAHINDGSEARDVTQGSDGTIFLANSEDGLRAYSYDGASFINTAHIYNGGNATRVAVGSDGTVFLANDYDGLRAYSYDGASFINTAHINDGGSAYDLAVGMDGVVFLANGDDGLRAYRYNGSSFTNTAHIDSGNDAHGVAVSADGTVFLATMSSLGLGLELELRAYSYHDTSLTHTAHIKTTGVGPLFKPYCGVEVGADGTVFLSNSRDGLQAYSYDGVSFVNTAHINDGPGHNVTVGADGTVYLAAGSEGLIAYIYSITTARGAGFSKIPRQYELLPNDPNPSGISRPLQSNTGSTPNTQSKKLILTKPKTGKED